VGSWVWGLRHSRSRARDSGCVLEFVKSTGFRELELQRLWFGGCNGWWHSTFLVRSEAQPTSASFRLPESWSAVERMGHI
jgi:hypothetical protein